MDIAQHLDCEAAQWRDDFGGLFIPLTLCAVGRLCMKFYLFLPCSREFADAILHGIEEEIADGR